MKRGETERFIAEFATAYAQAKKPAPRDGVTVQEYLERYRGHTQATGLLCARYGLWQVAPIKSAIAAALDGRR